MLTGAVMTDAVLPDAAPRNWVDRFAPAALRPWLKLGRFDRPTGIWLLMLPGWWGAALAASQQGAWPDWTLLARVALGAALMRAAGCAFNDIVDRDIDRRVARTAARPVASGAISRKGAAAFVAALSLAAFAILLTLGPPAIALGVASLALVAAYPFMKRITWWPQAWLGLTFNWGVLVAYAAAGGDAWWSALMLYAAGVFWTLGYDTIYALQDLEDDALAGVKSSARRLGGRVRTGVGTFYAASVALAAVPLVMIHSSTWMIYAFVLYLQVGLLKPDDPAQALRMFKMNVLAGVVLFAACLTAPWRMF